jgi:hypothetical protein
LAGLSAVVRDPHVSDRCVTWITVAADLNPESECIDGGERRTVRARSLGDNNMNKPVHELADTDLDRACGGSQWDMIELQSMMSKWQTITQQTTKMLHALSDATSTIVRNIR